MVTYTTVPALTDQDLGKVLLANYLKDGDPAGWFAPPFLLDKAFQVASNDGLTAVVAYRAGEPYSYTIKGIPLVTKTLKYAAIPSIVSGLVATKDGTNGVAITAGVVRYLNAAKEWKEVNVGAQTVLIGVPSTGVETVYIVAYDLETTPKIDAYKPAKSLFDAAPNAATVDPQEPAIIIARVDLDGAGNVIAIFNDGIHAGLESTKAEDLREMIGVIQHNIEPKIESKLKTTLSYSDLPDRYIIGYTNFGKAKQDNRFPYIGAMVDTKPTNVNTEFMDSTGNALIQSSGNIASQELSRYSSVSNPSGEPLKRGEFVLHPIFVYLDIENTPIINYAIVRSAVVFRKRPLATEPLEKQIKKYMLEETLGNTEVPQFITDFCTLCGFLVVDDVMDLRTTIAEALIIPATEGFSSIQERPNSLSAPTADEEGLLVVKEGNTAIAKGLPTFSDGSLYIKKSNGLQEIPASTKTWAQLRFSKSKPNWGKNKSGDLDSALLTKLRSNFYAEVSMLGGSDIINYYAAPSGSDSFTVTSNIPFVGSEFDSVIATISDADLKVLFDDSTMSSATVHKRLIHFNLILSYHVPDYETDLPLQTHNQIGFLDAIFTPTPGGLHILFSGKNFGAMGCRASTVTDNTNNRLLKLNASVNVAGGNLIGAALTDPTFTPTRFDKTAISDATKQKVQDYSGKVELKNLIDKRIQARPESYYDVKNSFFAATFSATGAASTPWIDTGTNTFIERTYYTNLGVRYQSSVSGIKFFDRSGSTSQFPYNAPEYDIFIEIKLAD